MRVQYNGFEFQMVHLRNLQMFTERDPTGYDAIMTRVELEISFQWHPYATASNTGNAAAPPFNGVGMSVQQLRTLLNTDRAVLRVAFGNDLIWQAPAVNPATGLPFACDPNYGPKAEVLGLSEIDGEYRGVGRWKVRFWVPGGSNVLLSNRWTVRAVTNGAGLTTRFIDGWAQCRANVVNTEDFDNIDDFRRWFLVPCPSGYLRTGATSEVNPIGTVAHFQATDQETTNPLGADGATVGAVEFTGQMSAGSTSNMRSNKDWLEWAGKVTNGWNFFSLPNTGALLSMIPQNVASGWVQVKGGKTVNKKDLARIAIAILQDRFPQGTVISAVCTQGVGQAEKDGRWVKVAIAFMPTVAVELGNAWAPLNFQGQMILDSTQAPALLAGLPTIDKNNIVLAGVVRAGNTVVLHGALPPDELNPDYKNYNLAGSTGLRPPTGGGPITTNDTGSRGDWLGALLIQSLQAQGQVPAVPPNNLIGTAPALV